MVLLETMDREGLPHLLMFTTQRVTAESELLLDYGKEYWLYYTAELNRLKAIAVSLSTPLAAVAGAQWP